MSNVDADSAYELALQRWTDFLHDPEPLLGEEWRREYRRLKRDLSAKMAEVERHHGVPLDLRG